MSICYVGIGSNLGQRRNNIMLALNKINALRNTKVLRLSRIISTNPVGGPSNQNRFLNAVAEIETDILPVKLLNEFHRIEHDLGRRRKIKWGPREIDLDILFYDNKVVNKKRLKIPHPRVFDRDFVKRPLLELL